MRNTGAKGKNSDASRENQDLRRPSDQVWTFKTSSQGGGLLCILGSCSKVAKLQGCLGPVAVVHGTGGVQADSVCEVVEGFCVLF